MAHFRVDPSVCFKARLMGLLKKKTQIKDQLPVGWSGQQRYRRGQAGLESRTSLHHFRLFFYATAKVVSITEMIFFYLIPLLYLGKFERMAVYLFTYFFVSQGLIRATVTAHTCHNSGLFMVYHKYKWRWCARITSHFQKNSNRLCRIYVPFCISFLLHDSGRRTYPSPQK